MRVLILGGTGFIGPHFVKAALERGHKISVFARRLNKDKNLIALPTDVELLLGDRNGDLWSLENRDWDAVFDLATYGPNWVKTLGEALHGRVGHYTFISSILAYKFPGATDEQSELKDYTGREDPNTLTMSGSQYGPLKALCEREAEKQFPGKTLILRPSNIIGPREHVGAFTYWVARMEQGGEVLAGGDPLTPVQLIDVRDLAEWVVRMAEDSQTGIFNVVGPDSPMGWAEMLGAVRSAFSAPMTLTWVPLEWLQKQDLVPSGAAIFWPSEYGIRDIRKIRNDKARNSGLVFRPLHETIADTLAWYRGLSAEQQSHVLQPFDRYGGSCKMLRESMARERELLAAWRVYQTRRSDCK